MFGMKLNPFIKIKNLNRCNLRLNGSNKLALWGLIFAIFTFLCINVTQQFPQTSQKLKKIENEQKTSEYQKRHFKKILEKIENLILEFLNATSQKEGVMDQWLLSEPEEGQKPLLLYLVNPNLSIEIDSQPDIFKAQSSFPLIYDPSYSEWSKGFIKGDSSEFAYKLFLKGKQTIEKITPLSNKLFHYLSKDGENLNVSVTEAFRYFNESLRKTDNAWSRLYHGITLAWIRAFKPAIKDMIIAERTFATTKMDKPHRLAKNALKIVTSWGKKVDTELLEEEWPPYLNRFLLPCDNPEEKHINFCSQLFCYKKNHPNINEEEYIEYLKSILKQFLSNIPNSLKGTDLHNWLENKGLLHCLNHELNALESKKFKIEFYQLVLHFLENRRADELTFFYWQKLDRLLVETQDIEKSCKSIVKYKQQLETKASLVNFGLNDILNSDISYEDSLRRINSYRLIRIDEVALIQLAQKKKEYLDTYEKVLETLKRKLYKEYIKEAIDLLLDLPQDKGLIFFFAFINSMNSKEEESKLLFRTYNPILSVISEELPKILKKEKLSKSAMAYISHLTSIPHIKGLSTQLKERFSQSELFVESLREMIDRLPRKYKYIREWIYPNKDIIVLLSLGSFLDFSPDGKDFLLNILRKINGALTVYNHDILTEKKEDALANLFKSIVKEINLEELLGVSEPILEFFGAYVKEFLQIETENMPNHQAYKMFQWCLNSLAKSFFNDDHLILYIEALTNRAYLHMPDKQASSSFNEQMETWFKQIFSELHASKGSVLFKSLSKDSQIALRLLDIIIRLKVWKKNDTISKDWKALYAECRKNYSVISQISLALINFSLLDPKMSHSYKKIKFDFSHIRKNIKKFTFPPAIAILLSNPYLYSSFSDGNEINKFFKNLKAHQNIDNNLLSIAASMALFLDEEEECLSLDQAECLSSYEQNISIRIYYPLGTEFLSYLNDIQPYIYSQSDESKADNINDTKPFELNVSFVRSGGGTSFFIGLSFLNGYGTHTYDNGAKYEGEWKNGRENGKGTYTWVDGSRYEGEWKNGRVNGYGTLTWADGAKYEGEWENDKRNGKGTYTWADGSRYEGVWKNGKRNGKGTYIRADGSRSEEEWINGKRK